MTPVNSFEVPEGKEDEASAFREPAAAWYSNN